MANGSELTKVKTGKVRASYVSLLKPKEEGGKYSVTLIIPKSDEATVKQMKAAIATVQAAETSKLKGSKKNPVHDGDGERPNGGEYGPECKGAWIVTASSRTKPGVVKPMGVNADGRPKFKEIDDEKEVYSGMYVRASLNAYAYDVDGSRGVAFSINNIVKVSDGEFLGGRASAEADFADDDFNYEEGFEAAEEEDSF